MAQILNFNDYKKCFVGFIDILGFSSSVKNITDESSFNSVASVLELLSTTADIINEDNNIFDEFNLTAVSDSLIVSVPASSKVGLYGLIYALHNLQYQLISSNTRTLLRGSIVVGNVYHKNGYIFGPGYMDAYKAESEIGGPPRIMLDPSVVNAIGEHGVLAFGGKEKSASELLRQDSSDGIWYIDYLIPRSSTLLSYGDDLATCRKNVESFVEEALKGSACKVKIHSKFFWLGKYLQETNSLHSSIVKKQS